MFQGGTEKDIYQAGAAKPPAEQKGSKNNDANGGCKRRQW
nr:MAG TPA: hypothetical protein [Caudoviricetes sp.]